MDSSETTPDRLNAVYERKKVRWDPTINTGHLLTMGASTISSLVFVMVSWATMDKRVVVLEEARGAQVQAAHDRQEVINDKFADVKATLSDIKSSVEATRREVSNMKHN